MQHKLLAIFACLLITGLVTDCADQTETSVQRDNSKDQDASSTISNENEQEADGLSQDEGTGTEIENPGELALTSGSQIKCSIDYYKNNESVSGLAFPIATVCSVKLSDGNILSCTVAANAPQDPAGNPTNRTCTISLTSSTTSLEALPVALNGLTGASSYQYEFDGVPGVYYYCNYPTYNKNCNATNSNSVYVKHRFVFGAGRYHSEIKASLSGICPSTATRVPVGSSVYISWSEFPSKGVMCKVGSTKVVNLVTSAGEWSGTGPKGSFSTGPLPAGSFKFILDCQTPDGLFLHSVASVYTY